MHLNSLNNVRSFVDHKTSNIVEVEEGNEESLKGKRRRMTFVETIKERDMFEISRNLKFKN
jgi:hypothetical protein